MRDFNKGLGNTDQSQSLRTTKAPWASDTPISVFTFLLNEVSRKLKTLDLAAKGNDMELFHFFHFLSAGPHIISQVRHKLKNKFESLKELILRRNLSLSSKAKSKQVENLQNNVIREYPPKDGHESNRQLNVIARAILICKDLVNLWKDIGYYEIVHDINDLSRDSKAFRSNWTRIDLSHLSINPERHMKTTNLWDFLRSYIGDKNGHYYFLEAMGNYYYKDI
ncbi:5583_t:CDS:2, partial [Gigaspora margarita]